MTNAEFSISVLHHKNGECCASGHAKKVKTHRTKKSKTSVLISFCFLVGNSWQTLFSSSTKLFKVLTWYIIRILMLGQLDEFYVHPKWPRQCAVASMAFWIAVNRYLWITSCNRMAFSVAARVIELCATERRSIRPLFSRLDSVAIRRHSKLKKFKALKFYLNCKFIWTVLITIY